MRSPSPTNEKFQPRDSPDYGALKIDEFDKNKEAKGKQSEEKKKENSIKNQNKNLIENNEINVADYLAEKEKNEKIEKSEIQELKDSKIEGKASIDIYKNNNVSLEKIINNIENDGPILNKNNEEIQKFDNFSADKEDLLEKKENIHEEKENNSQEIIEPAKNSIVKEKDDNNTNANTEIIANQEGNTSS